MVHNLLGHKAEAPLGVDVRERLSQERIERLACAAI